MKSNAVCVSGVVCSQVAIKSIRKESITDDLDRVHIQREIEITSALKHPYIIRFHEGENTHTRTHTLKGKHAYVHTQCNLSLCSPCVVFESRDKIVIVMEYASRGELYDYVNERRRLVETEARDIFRQITSAVHYCHTVNTHMHAAQAHTEMHERSHAHAIIVFQLA